MILKKEKKPSVNVNYISLEVRAITEKTFYEKINRENVCIDIYVK